VFPDFVGISFPIKRTAMWKTRKQVSISGKETAIADWSAPRYQWEIPVELLRSDAAFQELQALAAFYNSRLGGYDTFLYNDPDDNTVLGQGLGTGDGVKTQFQLVHTTTGAMTSGTFSWTDVITAPRAVSAVYLDGVLASSSTYAVTGWETTKPGILTFASPPGAGVAVSADFMWFFPCRFVDDGLDFEKFMAGRFEIKALKMLSIK
jgi:uncharacterized protein (TIGR02217 family)